MKVLLSNAPKLYWFALSRVSNRFESLHLLVLTSSDWEFGGIFHFSSLSKENNLLLTLQPQTRRCEAARSDEIDHSTEADRIADAEPNSGSHKNTDEIEINYKFLPTGER